MNKAPHRIRSLRWQIGVGSTAEAFSWRALLHKKGANLLLPVLEQGFDEAAPDERVIHIPRIELSVRLDSEGELDTILSGEILDQLRKQLQHMLADEETAGPESVWESITAERDRFEILLHYLHTGTLSWRVVNVSVAEQSAALSKTCHDEWPRMLEHLKVSREEAPFYFRLLQLLLEEEYSLLIQVLSEAIPKEFRTAAMQCLAMLLDEKSERVRHSHYTRLSLMAGILAESIGWQKRSATRSLFKVAAAAVPAHERHLLKKFVAARPRPVVSPFQKDGIDTVAWRFGTVPEIDIVELPVSPRHGLQTGLNRELDSEGTMDAQHRQQGVYSEKDGNKSVSHDICHQSCSGPSDGLFPMLVPQAGLVLLHPYIVRFFENCGVKDAGSEELRPSALPRAAALLHFLTTGREDLYEYELGLIKTVLGLHPETPLPVCAGLLTQENIEEAEALLQSVIDHWNVLKNTSIQVVRSSFIERQGLLRQVENGWRLNVERKPYDMLLDQIPWSIGIVKLPWMQRAIFAEW